MKLIQLLVVLISIWTMITSTPYSVVQRRMSRKKSLFPPVPHADDAIAVLIIACHRVTVSRCLEQAIKYRPSKERFPIIVSQDGADNLTSNVINLYKKDVYHIHHPYQNEYLHGYYKIAQHYQWALNVVFNHYNFDKVIVIEDDLDLSPDIYEYFAATLPLLEADPTLWCVSAYNDNGKLVDDRAVDLLYRTDFFPGLGWMLTKSLWTELQPKWPTTNWDEWMRKPAQRRGRSCIRPELSRTKTFGKVGVSKGLYFNEHLAPVHLNKKFCNFKHKDLSFLVKESYDPDFLDTVQRSPITSVQELLGNSTMLTNGSLRISYEYNNRKNFTKTLDAFELMNDLFSGIPRTAYLGIISFVYRNQRIYISPTPAFTDYDSTFKT